MKKEFPKLPKTVKVEIKKGESGALLARLPEYDVFTESTNLSDLFFQVNDLIYTYFDVPKKYQDDISFTPSKEAQADLIKIASQQTKTGNYSHFIIKSLYAPQLFDMVKQSQLI